MKEFPPANSSASDAEGWVSPAQHSLLSLASGQITSELTLGLLHKLNNVMTSIYFSMEAGRGALDPGHPALEAFASIEATIRQAQTLVTLTADVNLPPSAESTYVDVTEYCRSNLDLLKMVLPKNAVLEFKPAANPCYVKVAPEELREAILHLAMNISRRSSGKIRVRLQVLEARASGGGDGRIEIVLCDDAEVPADAELAFPSPSELTLDRLSDIGMARAEYLVRKQGGAVSCSANGSGTVFNISLSAVQ